MPPPTRSGRSAFRPKPFPSGPRIASSSPVVSEQSARVPGPIGSIRNASSLAVARQRLIGLGSRRPGASSMKNWPGTPGSSRPRSTRSSVYGPTGSAATTLGCSRFGIDSLLETERDLVARVGDGLDGRSGARERRDARHASNESRLADPVAVGARTRALWGVHDEVATPTADEVDDARGRPVLGHLPHVLDDEAGGGERPRRARRRRQLAAHRRQRLRNLYDRRPV